MKPTYPMSKPTPLFRLVLAALFTALIVAS